MSGYRELNDWNFPGWSNEQLATEVQRLSNGELARKFAVASEALRTLADSLHIVDDEMRVQLRALGIDWQGAAGEKAQEMTKVSAEGINDAGQSSQQSSDAMTRQQESSTTVRYNTPPEQDLRGDAEKNLLDKGAGFIGIETDHAAEVEATNRARQQAIDALNGYKSNSQGALDGFRAPNQAPDIVVASAAVSTPVGPTVGTPTVGTPGIHGGPAFTGSPGSPGSPGVPVGPPRTSPATRRASSPAPARRPPSRPAPDCPSPSASRRSASPRRPPRPAVSRARPVRRRGRRSSVAGAGPVRRRRLPSHRPGRRVLPARSVRVAARVARVRPVGLG
ncbi:PPE domain-containing protein [Lentzea kentuckyensis]|uniref:PPE domain-containing protein n=1 Tax=Lentzea kentuckyensis TaxID=360086 RepID=UPI00117AAAF7|nr:PPE domain-containing protein [Lentzea kentuckyensis]